MDFMPESLIGCVEGSILNDLLERCDVIRPDSTCSLGLPRECTLWPLPVFRMTRPHDFAADLAKAGKGFKEIKELVDSVYGIKGLKKTAFYDIINKVKAGNNTDDQRRFIAKETKRTAEKIEEISASI